MEKSLLSYVDVFAGITGVFFFNGTYHIKAEHLCAIDPVTLSLSDQARQSQRDVMMAWQEEGEVKAILMCENQSAVDIREPVRILGYIADVYRRQVETCRMPTAIVKAIVLNYSDRQWERHRDLGELLEKLPENIRSYFEIYAIRIIDVCFLSDEQLAMITGDFKGVPLYLREIMESRQLNVLKMIRGNNVPLRHPKEVMLLIRDITGDDRYIDIYEESQKEGGRITMMSDAVDAIMMRGEEIGFAKGERSGFAKGDMYGKAHTLITILSKKFAGHSFEWLAELDLATLNYIEEHIFDVTCDELEELKSS